MGVERHQPVCKRQCRRYDVDNEAEGAGLLTENGEKFVACLVLPSRVVGEDICERGPDGEIGDCRIVNSVMFMYAAR